MNIPGVLMFEATGSATCDSDFAGARSLLSGGSGPAGWAAFFKRVFGLLGLLAMVAGVIFFFAWNWADLPKFVKFGLAQAAFALCGGLALLRWRHWLGEAALLAAGLAIGAMFALYGQIYQTGADSWELFRAWSLLLLPLAILGRQTALWFLFWLVSLFWLNLHAFEMAGVSRDWDFTWHHSYGMLASWNNRLFSFACLLLWELAGHFWGKRQPWLKSRWFPRLIGFVLIWQVFQPCFNFIGNFRYIFFERGQDFHWSWFFWSIVPYALAWALGWLVYRRRKPDLFFPACLAFSLAALLGRVCFTAFFGRGLSDFDNPLAWLIMALAIVGLCWGCARGILNLQRSMAHEAAQAGLENAPAAAGIEDALRPESGRAEETAETLETPAESPAKSPDDEPESPWYVHLGLGMGAWVSAVFGLAALGFFVAMSSPREPEGILFMISLPCCGLAAWCLKLGGIFRSQFGTALGLAGGAGVCIAILLSMEFSGPEYVDCFICAGVFGLLYALLPGLLFRFIAGLVVTGGLALGWSFIFFRPDFFFHYDEAVVLSSTYAATIGLGLFFSLFFVLLAHSGGKLNKKLQADLRPLLYAGLLCCMAAAFAQTAMVTEWSGEGKIFLADYLGRALSLMPAAAGLWLFFLLPERNAASLALPAGALLLGLGSWFMPGIGLGLALLLLARLRLSQPLFGLGCAFLFFYLPAYYYSLHMSLLHKSLLLMATGAALLLLAWAARLVAGRFGLMEASI